MKKLLSNNKGSDYDGFVSNNKFFFYILLTIFVGLLITVFVVLIVRNMSSKTATDNSIDADFMLARITNQCLVHTDPLTGNVKQNTIDITKLTDEKLTSCFSTEMSQSFTIVLKSVNDGDFVKTTAKVGNPYVSDIAFARYVLVALENGEIKPGIIHFIP